MVSRQLLLLAAVVTLALHVWSVNADPCTPNPCQNGGTCAPSANVTSYTCMCGDLWSGVDCSTDVDECDASYAGPNGCSTNAVSCSNNIGAAPTCGACKPGYLGDGKTCAGLPPSPPPAPPPAVPPLPAPGGQQQVRPLATSAYFCGSPAAEPANSVFRTDEDDVRDFNVTLIRVNAFASATALQGIYSVFRVGPSNQQQQRNGYMQGGYNTGVYNSPSYTLDLQQQPSSPDLTVTAVRACCVNDAVFASGSGNGVQRLQLRMANGTVRAIGASGGGDPTVDCAQPQPWVDVPAGYVLAGLRSLVPWQNFSDNSYLDRISFIFAGIPPSPPPAPPPTPPPPPPQPVVTVSGFQCGSGVADYYVRRTSDVPYIEAGEALEGLQGLGQRSYTSRLQPVYRSGRAVPPPHGLAYQISSTDFALQQMYAPFPALDLANAWNPTSPLRITHVAACCSSGRLNIYDNFLQALRFRRANGQALSFGLGGSGECQRPQGWIAVPAGALLAGFVSDSFSDFAGTGVLNPTVVIDRIAFAFATPYPGQWTQPNPPPPLPPPPPPTPPPPPPPPPPRATLTSRFFCGSTYASPVASRTMTSSPAGAPGGGDPYTPAPGGTLVSDEAVAALGYPLTALDFTMFSFAAIYQARSTYGSYGPGPVHVTYGAGGGAAYGIDLTASWGSLSPERVVAVSACCYPDVANNQAMSPSKLLLRTASGRTIGIGYESPFASSSVCGGLTPQPWEPVPPGYLLGGMVTEKVGSEGFGFNRVGYVFVEASPPRPEDYRPPPSASSFRGSGSGSGSSGSGSGGAGMAVGIGVAVGCVALVGAALLTFLGLRRRARQRYGGEVAFDRATCAFYPTFLPPSPPSPPIPDAMPFAAAHPLPQPHTQFSQLGAPAQALLLPHALSSGRRQLSISQSVAHQIQLLMDQEKQQPQPQPQPQPGTAAGGTHGAAAAGAGEPWHLQQHEGGSAAARAAEVAMCPEVFSAAALSVATAGFDGSHLVATLGGGSRAGGVYRGVLPRQAGGSAGGGGGGGGREVAVWRLHDGNDTEALEACSDKTAAAVSRLSVLRHPHLLPLLGSCPDQALLVYGLGAEQQGSRSAAAAAAASTLADRLTPQAQRPLGWRDRVRVGAEVASAVAFLHSLAPPLLCRVPLDAGRVVIDAASGAVRLGFVGVAPAAAGGAPAAAASEEDDTRSLGVLLLRLLTGDATAEAGALVARVRGAQQADVAGGGGGRALAALVFDASGGGGGGGVGGGGDTWPASEALAFADVALRCCGYGGVSGGGAGPSTGSGNSGVPGLRSTVLPYLLQLSNRTRLYSQQAPQQAPAPAAAGLEQDAPPAAAPPAAAGDGADTEADADADVEAQPPAVDIPPLFVCPITQDVMEDPVVAADGFTYERAAIAEWMSCGAVGGRTPRSPLTNLPFEHRTVLPNRALKSQICSWRDEQAAAQQVAARARAAAAAAAKREEAGPK
ncbi:hypothetical protein HYH02_000552 [Chlamydomonas schloesseri]|uniref:Uncharacterized protein n=1 Tax=Chlamydomonas schloesseri TaxID=2026947 RepID=A0A836BDJ4_9CHLO|nr:hypothetical protein HYH02_000552 [Chlamydomonas schloesseri]|eukprot:KAG2454715.1 hypothetical protein HYH02_000552 [Chlamydomonas schloesseri]